MFVCTWKVTHVRYWWIGICFSMLSLLAGCSLGPTALKGSRLGYNQHLHASNNEELLINMVRLRYGEQPFFLQVGSISASFGQSTTVGVNSSHLLGSSAAVKNTVSPSLGYVYSESPTIIYTPIQGAEYARRFLTQVDLVTFLLLAQGDWSIRTLIRLTATRVGQLYNPIINGPQSFGPENNDAMFMELINFFKKLERRGDLKFVSLEQPKDDVECALVQLRFTRKQEATRMEELLGTDIPVVPLPSGKLLSTLRLTPLMDFGKKKPGDVCFTLRNLQQIFWAASFGIVEKGQETIQKEAHSLYGVKGDVRDQPILIMTSPTEPENAYTKVFTRNQWYYIKDGDYYSKFCLGVLGALYSLQTDPPNGAQPVITIPVSG